MNNWESWDWRSQLCWLLVWFLEGACPRALPFLPCPISHAFSTNKTTVERVGRTEYSLGVGEGEAGTNATGIPVALRDGESLLCNPWACSCA